MIVHDRVYVRPSLVDRGVDEALDIRMAPPRVERGARYVELHQVVGGDERGCAGARHDEVRRPFGMAAAHVPERVDHALAGQDAVGGKQVVDRDGERLAHVALQRGSHGRPPPFLADGP